MVGELEAVGELRHVQVGTFSAAIVLVVVKAVQLDLVERLARSDYLED